MSAAGKSRARVPLDEFLLDYLPQGTDALEHEIVVGVVEGARAKIVARLRKAGHLRDEDDPPMREAC